MSRPRGGTLRRWLSRRQPLVQRVAERSRLARSLGFEPAPVARRTPSRFVLAVGSVGRIRATAHLVESGATARQAGPLPQPESDRAGTGVESAETDQAATALEQLPTMIPLPTAPGAGPAEEGTERAGPGEDGLALLAGTVPGEAAASPVTARQALLDLMPAARTEGAAGPVASHHTGPAMSPPREDIAPMRLAEPVPDSAWQGAPQGLAQPSAAAVPANGQQQAAPVRLLAADGALVRSPAEPIGDNPAREGAGADRGERIASTAEPVGAMAAPTAPVDAAIDASASVAQAILGAEASSPIEPSPDPASPAPTENDGHPETPEAVPARTTAESAGDGRGLVDMQLVAARSDPPPSAVTADRPVGLVARSVVTATDPGDASESPELPFRDRQDAQARDVLPALLADKVLNLPRSDPEPAPAVGGAAAPRVAPAFVVEIAPVPAVASETERLGHSDEFDAAADQEATIVPSGPPPATLSRTRVEPADLASATVSSEALPSSTASASSAPQPPAVAGSLAVQREVAPGAYPNAKSADRSESPALPSAAQAATRRTAGDQAPPEDAPRALVPVDTPATDRPEDRLDAEESVAGEPGDAAAGPGAARLATPEDDTGRAWPEDADRPTEERPQRELSPEPPQPAVVGVSQQPMWPEPAAPSAAVPGGPVSGNALSAPSGAVPAADGNPPVGDRAHAEGPAALARSLDLAASHAQTIGASQPVAAAFAAPGGGATDDSGPEGHAIVEPVAGDGPPMATLATPLLPDEPVERPPMGEEVGPASSAPPVVAPNVGDSQIAPTVGEASAPPSADRPVAGRPMADRPMAGRPMAGRPASDGSAYAPSLDGSIEPAGAGAGGTAHAPVASPPAIVQRAVATAPAPDGAVASAASALPARPARAAEREAAALAPGPEVATAPSAAGPGAVATSDPAPPHTAAAEPASDEKEPDAGGELAPDLGPRAEQVAEIVHMRPRPAGVPLPVRPQATRNWAAEEADQATAERLERLAHLLVPDVGGATSSPPPETGVSRYAR